MVQCYFLFFKILGISQIFELSRNTWLSYCLTLVLIRLYLSSWITHCFTHNTDLLLWGLLKKYVDLIETLYFRNFDVACVNSQRSSELIVFQLVKFSFNFIINILLEMNSSSSERLDVAHWTFIYWRILLNRHNIFQLGHWQKYSIF